MENQRYIGEIKGFDEEKKTVESIVLHFDTPNENMWMAKAGSLKAFLDRIKKANKGVAACYQHDEKTLIGVWRDFKIEGNAFIATLHLSDTPFVRDTVIPQLKDGTLQGSSPTIAPVNDTFDNEKGVWAIIEGILCEISLVGLPADLEANVLRMTAKIEEQKRKNKDFELEILF